MNGWFGSLHFLILKNWKKLKCVLFHGYQHFRNMTGNTELHVTGIHPCFHSPEGMCFWRIALVVNQKSESPI